MKSIIDSINSKVPKQDKEYMGEDGFLHCSVCHARVERIAEVPQLNIRRKVRCVCKCKNDMDFFLERQEQDEKERMRNICFFQAKADSKDETNMKTWNFENDDRQHAKISDALLKYTEQFQTFKKEGKGLLLYGTVGTGKTYLAACVANRMIDQNVRTLMINFSTVCNKLSGMFEGKQEYLDSLNSYTLLIIDDLGAERKSEYMQELIFNIIDARYRSGLPMVITTNLTADEIKKPQDVGYARIYDRILERCIPVEVSGKSRRREKVRQNLAADKALLGL